MNDPVMRCNNLHKTYVEGKHEVLVLRGLELVVVKGEMLAIVGASGSGKSTLLQLMGGLDTPTSGEVTVAGQVLHSLKESARCQLRNQHLGFIYQFHHLLPEFNALENVCLPLLIRGDTPSDAKDQAAELLTQVGLQERLTHRVGELSGGERQRVAIARALVTKPSCVLADEPTGNLDSSTAQHVFETMQQLNESTGTSFIIVTHDLSLAQSLPRCLTLEGGVLTTV